VVVANTVKGKGVSYMEDKVEWHGMAPDKEQYEQAMAELELVGTVLGEPPLLLLDDVLAELDPERQQLLLEAVGEGHQCLVSATHLGAFSGGWQAQSQLVHMHAGQISAHNHLW
jgi:hypothetical protein